VVKKVPDFFTGSPRMQSQLQPAKKFIFFATTHLFAYLTTLPVKSGHAVAQLIEALRYKPERRGFDSRWCHWNFSLA
jgi:hypothetical protein